MAVITLPAFVVIAQHACPIDNERQAIFKPVFAPEHRLGNLPDDAFDAGRFGNFSPESIEEPRSHVVNIDNAMKRCQWRQRLAVP